MTRYAVADIHGGNLTFRALVTRLKLHRDDRLYLLGDYVDRGPDSKGVLDAIMMMLNAGYDVRPVRGNHDDLLLRTITGNHDKYSNHYMDNWGFYTLLNFDAVDPADITDKYRNFLASLPFILEDDGFIFVHAALDMNEDNPLADSAEEVMLWGNGPFPVHNEIAGRTIVSGHKLRTCEQIAASLSMPHIQMDNGAFTNQQPEYGNLMALNLETMELILQPWLDGEANI